MTVQTSQRLEDRVGRPGMVADGDSCAVTRIAEAAMRPGGICLRGVVAAKAGKGVRPPVAAAAADADGFKTNIGSTAGIQTFTGADFQGVIGTSRLVPGRNLVLVCDAHTDWNPTTAVATFEDEYGRVVTEDLAVATSGTATGTKICTKIISLVIPAQTGTGGTAVLGTGTLLGPLTGRDVVGIAQYLAARQLATGATTEFAAEDTLSVLEEGRAWVEVEEDVLDGEQVYLRFVIAGVEIVGAFRNDRDGTAAAPDAVPVIGMRFVGNSTTDEDTTKVCRVQFDFRAT